MVVARNAGAGRAGAGLVRSAGRVCWRRLRGAVKTVDLCSSSPLGEICAARIFVAERGQNPTELGKEGSLCQDHSGGIPLDYLCPRKYPQSMPEIVSTDSPRCRVPHAGAGIPPLSFCHSLAANQAKSLAASLMRTHAPAVLSISLPLSTFSFRLRALSLPWPLLPPEATAAAQQYSGVEKVKTADAS